MPNIGSCDAPTSTMQILRLNLDSPSSCYLLILSISGTPSNIVAYVLIFITKQPLCHYQARATGVAILGLVLPHIGLRR